MKKKTPPFPPPKTLRRIRKKLSRAAYEGGNIALPANASELDRTKYELCQLMARYQREHRLLQKELADRIGIDTARISNILRGRIESFTLDRLIGYAERIHPGLKIKIVAA